MRKNPWLTALAGSAAAALLLGVAALAVQAFPLAAAAGDDTVYKLEGDVTAPVEISRPQPRYPEEAKKNHVEGVVVIEAVIDQKGAVISAKAVKSPDEQLSGAAIEAVQKWTYRPATKKGQPVRVSLTVTVTFKLA